MCEATVYLGGEGQEMLMRDVVLVEPEGDGFLLINLMGERKLVRGRIKKIDFLKHSIVLEGMQGGTALQIPLEEKE
jgi:predicted RNA-binding protein